MGTAQSYIDDDEISRRQALPSQHIYRLRFERMIENSLDVIRAFCLLFCGPFIMTECLLSVIFYSKILTGCKKIPDGFVNVLVYVLIVMGCISLTVTAFCCYVGFVCGRTVKEVWP